MKVSINWLKELVDLKVSDEELTRLLPLRTIGIKEATDDFIELDMKGYNRADLLSMRGVAREAAAITNSKITFEDLPAPKFDIPKTSINVENQDLCPVYCIAKIEGLKVEPSNAQWVKKLEDSGMRSVNNVADVTNLVMLEFGQPMHAFDAKTVTDETLVVRTAKPGEKLTTLDGKVRNLDQTDLLITDPEKPLGIAGVMGGKDSEVSNTTSTILLEAAIFDPVSIRRSSKRHGLNSEASRRFQHGLTKTNLLQALTAALKMYQSLGGKLTGLSIVSDLEDQPKTIQLTQDKINSLLGVRISAEQAEKYLQSLGFKVEKVGGAKLNHLEGELAWHVIPPYWRLDINIEEDVIEEVTRMYGYEKIPAKELRGELPEKLDQSFYNFIHDLKVDLKNAGLTEVQTYSFYSTQVLNALGFNQNNQDNLVKIANPISSETEYLREFIWPNLMEVVSKNLRQGFNDIAIFEVGKVYQPQKSNLPKEPYRLAVVLMNGSDNPIQELAAIVKNVHPRGEVSDDQLAYHLGGVPKVGGAKLNHLEGVLEIKPGGIMEELENLFHPNRFATVSVGDKIIGGLAEVHPRFLNHFGVDKRVAILEINLEPLL